MSGENLRDIRAFLTVASERSFTRAAAKLGVSQSALSHTISALEARLGLRLLTRTTRSVAPTEAGQRLVERVAPRFDVIANELSAFNQFASNPGGTVRITTSDFAAKTVLWPKLSHLQRKFPDLKIEMSIDAGLTDIVLERFDASIRFGDQVAKDMTAVRISPDIRMTIVGAASYFENHPVPKTPSDLTHHACINVRFSPRGSVYAWELKKGKRDVQVRVEGSWTFNCIYPALDAALAGFGLAYMPEEIARQHVDGGRLQPVLKDWCPTFPGLHICYVSRRESSTALSLIVETLRYEGRAR
ncbi:LysR family transcriptional regulator [Caballeronia novacaledonica]|uniref:LysR family transcriptional regulator n=1 Tax=Caballeronia novacaledonica TaxID=1544861 RepID=A0AA37IDC5_9BURK|nr:LysR family transcriptional regulator [Caballeronia novacaledonica]GJH27082.1 LysR family transcriptional regulator [Caballeronia novacaledonica]